MSILVVELSTIERNKVGLFFQSILVNLPISDWITLLDIIIIYSIHK